MKRMKRKKSLRLHAIAVMAIVFLIPSLTSFIYFYHIVPPQMEAQAEANAGFYIDKEEAAVSESMELTKDVAFNAIANRTLSGLMQSSSPSLFSTAGRSALQSSVGSTVAFQSVWSNRFLSAVYLFRDDGQVISYSTHGTFEQEQHRLQDVYEETKGQSSALTFFRPKSGEQDMVYFVLDYKNIDTLAHLGKLIIELNSDVLMGSDDLVHLYPDTCLALTNGSTLLYTKGENLSALLSDPAVSHTDTAEYIKSTQPGLKEDYYHVSRKIDNDLLRLDIFIPVSSINSSVRETSHLYLSFCLIILLLTLVFGSIASYSSLHPLRELEDTLSRMAKSDYSARMPESDYQELAQLQETFNRMADNLEASFQDAYQKGIQLQESEFRLLTAQINPHFIFNVLETINMRCVDAGLKDISRMVTDLAQLLRGNIGVGYSNQKVTFDQELKYVHYYLGLQQNRFGQNLSYSVDYADDEILSYLLPRLTIQPLVENAIVHGLEPRRGLGYVSVKIWEEDNSVYIRVEDNGIGFNPAQVNLSENADDGRHNHIALPNILRRLRLFYGDRASLELHSQPDSGTTVLLVIPIDRKES